MERSSWFALVVGAWLFLQGLATLLSAWPSFSEKTIPAFLAERGLLRMSNNLFGWLSLAIGAVVIGLLIVTLVTRRSQDADGAKRPDLSLYFSARVILYVQQGELWLYLPVSIGNRGIPSTVTRWTAVLDKVGSSERKPFDVTVEAPGDMYLSGMHEGAPFQELVRNIDLLPKRTLQEIPTRNVSPGYLVLRSQSISEEELIGSVLVIGFNDDAGNSYLFRSQSLPRERFRRATQRTPAVGQGVMRPELAGYFLDFPQVSFVKDTLYVVLDMAIGNSGAQTRVSALSAVLLRANGTKEALQILADFEGPFKFTRRDGTTETQLDLKPDNLLVKMITMGPPMPRHAIARGYLIVRAGQLSMGALDGSAFVILFRDDTGRVYEVMSPVSAGTIRLGEKGPTP